MSRLEAVILVIAAAAAALRWGGFAAPLAPAVGVVVLVGVFAVALALNPWRWPLAPVGVLVVVLGVMTVAGAETAGLTRHLALVGALALVALSAALTAGFPVRPLAAPSGPYAVGVVGLDMERPAVGDDGGMRRLRITVWYPAASGAEAFPREPLWGEFQEPGGFPAPLRLLTRYLCAVPTHSRRGAPAAPGDAPPPLLVYSHSLISIASENTLLMEELASRGCVVASLRHRDQLAEQAAVRAGVPADETARDRAIQARLAGPLDRAERAALSAELFRTSTGTSQIVARRAGDACAVVDRIAEVFAAIPGWGQGGRPPPDRYGALGLSLGGAVATRLSAEDPRCAAAASLDGGLYGVVDLAAVRGPYLMLYSEGNVGGVDALRDAAAASGATFEEHAFAGAAHLDFHDAHAALPALRWLGALGRPRDAGFATRKHAVVADFFDRTLAARR